MKLRLVRGIVLWRYFPLVPQVVVLVAYIALVAGAIGVDTDIRHIGVTNLSTFLVWTLWWPIVLVSTILLGRLWCVVCPLELVSSVASTVGLKKRPPPLLRSGWVMTGLYAFMLVIVLRTWNIRGNPHSNAIYLLVALAVAVGVGLVYRKRAFCSYVCPIGSLLGLYSRAGCLEWSADDPAVCRTCKTRDCAASGNYYRLTGRSCTSELHPARMNDGKDCLLCTQCATACPNENLKISLRKPGFALFEKIDISAAEIGLLLVITCYLNNGPKAFYFIAVPLLLGLMFQIESPKDYIKAYFVVLIPMAVVGYLSRGVAELFWTAATAKFAFTDPIGIRTAELLQSGALKIDDSGWRTIKQCLPWFWAAMRILSLATAILIVFKGQIAKGIERPGKAAMVVGAVAFFGTFYMKHVLMFWQQFVQAIAGWAG